MKKNNKGFTLVELIVVIAILGVLMAVLVPQYIQYVEKSRQGVDESIFSEIAHNMEIGSATTEALGSGTYTATITPNGTGNAATYTIAEGVGGDSAAASKLDADVKLVIPEADTKLKSKLYTTGIDSITITMTNGKVIPDTTTKALFSINK